MTSFVKLEQTNYDDKKISKRKTIKKYTNWYYFSYFM